MRTMRCVRCGAAFAPESERCARCGALAAALASAPPFLPDPHGVPVQHFNPTLMGPPVAPEPYIAANRVGGHSAQIHRQFARLHMVLPQAQPRRSQRGRSAGLTMLLVALVVLGGLGAGALARGGGLLPQVWPLPFEGLPNPNAGPRPTSTPACLVAPSDAAAARNIAQVTLTTELRAPESQDFRPVDSVSTFHTGQRAYITFQITTAEAGTVGVTFCTPAGRIPGALDIPGGSNGQYAQFSLALDATHTGLGVATLTWNGAVAASLPFTVVA